MNDNSEYLSEAIKSMLEQTVVPNQIVIVEDGPILKELHDVINKYASENQGLFTIVKVERNVGLANALNIGLDYCRNELVARMDADDISLPMRCEKELEMFIKNEHLVVCGCNIDEFSGNINNIETSRIVPSKYKDIIRFGRTRQPFNHPTVMYKRSEIINMGGYSNLKRKEDFDLFSRLINERRYAQNIDESLYLYRANDNNYYRRKSITNLLSAFEAYGLHWKRGGCNIVEFLFMCSAEILFFILPLKAMKKISDNFLRKKMRSGKC